MKAEKFCKSVKAEWSLLPIRNCCCSVANLVIWVAPVKFPFEQLESVELLRNNLIQGIQQNSRKSGNWLWLKLNRRIDLPV